MDKYDYTSSQIVNSLKEIGLKNGDNIFVHSNLGYFGILKDANSKEDYWKIFKDSIFKVIGNDGTLIVPTFTYSFCWNHDFDLNSTPSIVGMFSEMVRTDLNSVRSEDGNFSVSAIGKNAIYFTENAPIHSFGINSFWDRFIKKNGKICCFNVGLVYNTLIHYVEKLLNVPYRYDKLFSGIFIKNGLKENRKNIHFVRDLNDPKTLPDLTELNKIAYGSKKAKDSMLGKGQISCIDSKNVVSIITKELKKNPAFLIKNTVS